MTGPNMALTDINSKERRVQKTCALHLITRMVCK